MFSKLCSPNQVMWDITSTVSLHCFLFACLSTQVFQTPKHKTPMFKKGQPFSTAHEANHAREEVLCKEILAS